jgi:hypothetical protein
VRSFGVSRSMDPFVRRPFVAAVSAAIEEEEPASDAPCHDAPEPKPRNAARTASPASSSKETAFTARSAFHRRVPARWPLAQPPRTRTRHRSSGFATRVRLPNALSPFAAMRKD